MEQNPLISVIVPVYKVEDFLPKCVESICAQTYHNLEIFLVDDGSPDRCGEMCDAFARQDSRIRVIHKPNGGLSSARNAAIDVASGDYLAFVDSDDWIAPDTYEAMLDAARKYDAKMVCAGRYDVNGATGECEKGLCPEREEAVSGEEMVKRILTWDHLDSAAWDKLYARELFLGIRYPDGRVVEDVPTTYRLALRAGKVVLLPKPVYFYLHRENSITTAAVSDKSFHGSQHAAMVYADLRKSIPALEPYARYFWIMSVMYKVRMLQNADSASREKYAAESRSGKRDLQKNLPFVLGSALFSRREKTEISLLASGLYGVVRKAYYVVRKKA